MIVERLEVMHRTDDDNVYFIGSEHSLDLIQLDTADGGQPPFLMENSGRYQTTETSEAAAIIVSWLQQSCPAASATYISRAGQTVFILLRPRVLSRCGP